VGTAHPNISYWIYEAFAIRNDWGLLKNLFGNLFKRACPSEGWGWPPAGPPEACSVCLRALRVLQRAQRTGGKKEILALQKY